MLRVLLFLVAGALVMFSARPGSENATKPNIVFIVVDDLGWNDVGWHNPDVKTPVLDQLAHEGVILNQSYVNYVYVNLWTLCKLDFKQLLSFSYILL
ncbi:arylsulfatase B-like [Branchiostoma floridae x Branchiostoma japonicum]